MGIKSLAQQVHLWTSTSKYSIALFCATLLTEYWFINWCLWRGKQMWKFL